MWVIKGISLVTPIYSVIYSVSNAFKALLDFFTASEHIASCQISLLSLSLLSSSRCFLASDFLISCLLGGTLLFFIFTDM